MATIKEDYVSFEVAKLLKEKGFNEPVTELNKLLFKDGEKPILEITHQKAMKWLREKHKLYIGINIEVGDIQMLPSYDFEEIVLGYSYAIYNEETLIWVFKDKTPRSYEEAVEAAIKYCLEILI